RSMDLPMANRRADRKPPAAETPLTDTAPPDAVSDQVRPDAAPDQALPDATREQPESDDDADSDLVRIRRDPLAYLAALAGYDDGEAWWNALVEQGAHGPALFAAPAS